MDLIKHDLGFESNVENPAGRRNPDIIRWIKRQNDLQEKIDNIHAAWMSKDKGQIESAIAASIKAHFDLTKELGMTQ
jgi:hypothetical protein